MLQIIKNNRLGMFILMTSILFPMQGFAAVQSPLNAGTLMNVFGALLIVLALIILIYLITRGRFKAKKPAPFQISVVSRINIDSKHQIILIKVDENYLLVGTGNLSLIKELGSAEGIDFKSVVEGLGGKNSSSI